jgi:hypothetical protein
MSNGYGKEEYGHIAGQYPGQYSCPTAKQNRRTSGSSFTHSGK